MWIFSDPGKSSTHDFLVQGNECVRAITSVTNHFRGLFLCKKFMQANLRNTYEISSILSIVRGFLKDIDISGNETINWLLHKEGHFLRGAIPTIYLLRDDNPASWKCPLVEDVVRIKQVIC